MKTKTSRQIERKSPLLKIEPDTSLTRPGPNRVASLLCALAAILALVMAQVAPAATLPVQDGLVVWLKADAVNPSDANQVRLSGTDVFVKQWVDQSGNNHPDRITVAHQGDCDTIKSICWRESHREPSICAENFACSD